LAGQKDIRTRRAEIGGGFSANMSACVARWQNLEI
jgi:hypothetical protein